MITDVRVKKVNGEKFGKIKAYVDITFEKVLVVHGLKLIEGENGLFVAMPSRKLYNTEYKDIVHPINSELRKHITEAVIEKYNNTPDVETSEVEEIAE